MSLAIRRPINDYPQLKKNRRGVGVHFTPAPSDVDVDCCCMLWCPISIALFKWSAEDEQPERSVLRLSADDVSKLDANH